MYTSKLIGLDSGFGECIILELPENKIGIIDCCFNRKSKIAVPLEYLENKSIDLDNVIFVVLTHFHQDHYLGIAEVLAKCKNAEFFTSAALVCEPFNMLLALFMEFQSYFNPYKEFQNIIDELRKSNRKINVIQVGSSPIYSSKYLEITIEAPNEYTINEYRAHYYTLIRKLLDTTVFIPAKKNFNLQSIVLRIRSTNANTILGGDLEYHNDLIGWEPIFKSLKQEKAPIRLFKVPHHGSQNGYNFDDWNLVLDKNSILKITPFHRFQLPPPSQIEKMKRHSTQIYSTASIVKQNSKNHPPHLRKLIKDFGLNIKRVNPNLSGSVSYSFIDNSLNLEGSAISL